MRRRLVTQRCLTSVEVSHTDVRVRTEMHRTSNSAPAQGSRMYMREAAGFPRGKICPREHTFFFSLPY